MIKKRFNSNTKSLKLCAMFLFPFALFGGVCLSTKTTTVAVDQPYVRYYNEKVELTNASFTQGAIPFTKGDSLSGWNVIEKENSATGMLIDVGRGSNTDDNNNETTTFSNNKEEYMLSSNPGFHGEDSRILMINSKSKSTQRNVKNYKGYRSSSITLEANSYYVFSVSAKVMLNGDNSALGSIYLSGIKDKDDESIKIGYEKFTNTTWKEYYIFVATGDSSQTVTLDLYLGTNDGLRSEGAVFFDNVNITRYSQNQFMENCYDYGYKDNDSALIDLYSSENENVFLVNTLQPDFSVVNYDNYNFDFEDPIQSDSDTLGEHWKIIAGGRNNGSARVVDIRNIQQRDFADMTGYNYVGDNLNYNNNQALVLWTSSNEYSSGGYVGVKSENINIEAHGIYKVSLKMKVAGMENGSFYLQVTENENIYTAYPTILSSNSDDKKHYELQSNKTSGITSNVTNVWTNDYQTVELYIKGHDLFNTSVNLELWLGDSEKNALGCVVIDDIMIEHADYSSFSGASNKLELKWKESTSGEINNASFNKTESNSELGKYPLPASNWTSTIGEEKNSESGVIYLADKEEYDRLYKGKYAWAGINPNRDNNPNNVYMMFNKVNSYQSLLSDSFSLTKDSYYKLSFDYYNQLFDGTNSSKIKVEVIDENGIELFSQEGISSLDTWSTMEIYLHTAEMVAHSIQIKISLGEENAEVGGMVYLDNFAIYSNESLKDSFNNAQYKSELGNYYLNLGDDNFTGVKKSPAYSLEIDEVYDSNYTKDECNTISGIANGKNNSYGITNENNLLVITNVVSCSSTVKSNYSFTLESDSYYELTFDLATIFGENAGKSTDKHNCKYGVKVTIDGYDAISGLVAKEELSTYKIYYHSTSSATPKVSFTLISDCENTLGTALFTNIDFKKTDEYTFNNVPRQAGYNSSIFSAKQSTASDEDNSNNDVVDVDKNTNTSSDSKWLLIPSLIMALALIIAIIGVILRKVKIKKIEKIKQESYDRKVSVNHDVILAEAQKKRDQEVAALSNAKTKLIEEKQLLESEHKEYVLEQRKTLDGKLTRSVEKEFKNYNSQISRLDEKINILKEKIDYCMSADYLLSIQNRLTMEEDERLTAERRERKAQAKEAKKTNNKNEQ